MDIRSLQRPLKEQYRQNPSSSRITLKARGSQTDAPVTCSVDLGREIYKAQAHQGVGGEGTGACSGDLLLGAIAACAQITCQMVAAAMGIPTEGIDVTVEGDLDLQGTLGISKEAAVGFESIRVCSTSVHRRQPGSSCARCRRKRNSIVWSCRPWSIPRKSITGGWLRDSKAVSLHPYLQDELTGTRSRISEIIRPGSRGIRSPD